MFIRSENLFVRPAWPEDRPTLEALNVPSAHDPMRIEADGFPLVLTMPEIGSGRIVGTGVFQKRKRMWQPRIWLAPAFRHLGLFAEAEDALLTIAQHLPDPSGIDRQPQMQLAAA